MYRKIGWFYLIVLALLDISINTNLSAQGKSHGNGVSVHESLMEGISLQDWGKDAGGSGAHVALWPRALSFGARALAAPHARAVTLTNVGNDTVHLASVAGTTPEFYASYFDTKTLAPQSNTSFTVVYLGRREGPASTKLFVHTSKGIVELPVSAVGVASEWRVWPLVGVRVPQNASLEPLLTLYNPTDTTVQVSEVYSTGAWLGLALPAGGAAAARALWTLPPRAARPLVRLRLRPAARGPLHAYVRIRANVTGGGLVLAVEAAAAPPGEFLHPLQIRLRPRGSLDPPDTFELEAGNSEQAAVRLEAEVWGARCGAAPPPPARPPHDAPPLHANGERSSPGAHVSLRTRTLAAGQPLTPAATLTLDYGAMWAAAVAEGAVDSGSDGGAWCAGWVRVGRAAAPYSVRVLPGALRFTPPDLQYVHTHSLLSAGAEGAVDSGSDGGAWCAGWVRVGRAAAPYSVRVLPGALRFTPPDLQYVHTHSLLSAGAEGAVDSGSDGGAWCAGWVRVGRAAAPYSVRVLPGALRFTPPDLQYVHTHSLLSAGAEGAVDSGSDGGAWCAGWVRVGRAAAPYSVRVLPGALRFTPPDLQYVHTHSLLSAGAEGAVDSGSDGGAWCAGWVRVGRAAAPYSVRVLPGALRFTPPDLQYVHTHSLLSAGAEGAVDSGSDGGAWCAGWVRVGRAAAPYSVRVLPGALRFTPPDLQYVHTHSLLSAGAEGAVDSGSDGGAWCAGWVRVGRAAAPYSVRVLPGALRFTPPDLHIVTARAAEAFLPREVRVHNEFALPVKVEHVDFPPEVQELFHTESLAPLVVGGGGAGAVARVRLRGGGGERSLRAALALRTNLTDYTLPLLLYEGRLHIEWVWPGAADTPGALHLGAVCASATRRVRARLRNAGAAPLCVTELAADLPGATFELDHPDKPCVEGGAWIGATLTVVAPARAGAVAGAARAHTPHARAAHAVTLHAHDGRLAARALLLDNVAPYVWARAPLVLESSMQLRMHVAELAPAHAHPDPALFYLLPEDEKDREVKPGTRAIGTVVYAAERACGSVCATGLALDGAEGAAWVARGAGALAADRALARARRALLPRAAAERALAVHTTRVRAVPAAARVRWAWPALAARGAGRAGLAPVGGAAELLVRVRNPAERALLVQPVLAEAPPPPGEPAAAAAGEWAPRSFSLGEWRAARGDSAPWSEEPAYLLLAPHAEADLVITFAPEEAADLVAHLYLRNNLTILEGVPLWGRGAHPSFEVAGRAPNSSEPIALEVGECGAGGAGTVRRALLVRNTGAVRVRLRDWRLGGAPCAARGFRLQPCAALELAPNETRALTLAYTPDWTRARAAAPLTVRAGAAQAEFALAGVAPARLLARCAPAAPRPPFEPALRALGDALALLALAGAVALAALDAERALRRHRAARDPPPQRAPLDLRALAHPPPAPARAPEPPAARRRRTPRRRAAPLDAAAERRAFERWRAEVTRRAPAAAEGEAPAPAAGAAPLPRGDASSSSAESSPPPRDRSVPYLPAGGASSGSDSSAGSERSERSEPEDESPARAPPPADRSASDSPALDTARHDSPPPPAHTHTRGPTSRRESGSGRSVGAEARARAARSGARKERCARRRSRAASPPAAAEPARGAAGGGRAPPAVRWGASWSSVVSRGAAADAPPPPPRPPAPLAPIGSDVPRRAASHSLFYYGAAEPPPPPPPPAAPAPDYPWADYRSLESVWGASMEPHPAAAVWLWGGAGAHPAAAAAPVRPPPGFAPRDYDPFHSLASIWTPAALDWRRRDPAEPADRGDSAEPAAAGAYGGRGGAPAFEPTDEPGPGTGIGPSDGNGVGADD